MSATTPAGASPAIVIQSPTIATLPSIANLPESELAERQELAKELRATHAIAESAGSWGDSEWDDVASDKEGEQNVSEEGEGEDEGEDEEGILSIFEQAYGTKVIESPFERARRRIEVKVKEFDQIENARDATPGPTTLFSISPLENLTANITSILENDVHSGGPQAVAYVDSIQALAKSIASASVNLFTSDSGFSIALTLSDSETLTTSVDTSFEGLFGLDMEIAKPVFITQATYLSIVVQSPTLASIASIAELPESFHCLAVPDSKLAHRQSVAKELHVARVNAQLYYDSEATSDDDTEDEDEDEEDEIAAFEKAYGTSVENPLDRARRRVETRMREEATNPPALILFAEVPASDRDTLPKNTTLYSEELQTTEPAELLSQPESEIESVSASSSSTLDSSDSLESALDIARRRVRERHGAYIRVKEGSESESESESGSVARSDSGSSFTQSTAAAEIPEECAEKELKKRLAILRKAVAERHSAYEEFTIKHGLARPPVLTFVPAPVIENEDEVDVDVDDAEVVDKMQFVKVKV
ncbi:hypothetical protein BOTBODRAFT_33357, partial [Botryobasidium botryosum FD-172 SS1]